VKVQPPRVQARRATGAAAAHEAHRIDEARDLDLPARPAPGEAAAGALDVPASVALDLLATGVVLLDGDGCIAAANASAENLLGLSRTRMAGQPLEALFGDCVPLRDAIARAEGAHASYTEQAIEGVVPGGARVHLACTVTPADLRGARLVLELRPIEAQLRIAREERLHEQQQAHRELIRSLAHEIKNPLGGIRGAAQLLERELADPRLSEYTQVIIGEADRLQSLVSRLLTPHRLPVRRSTNVHELLVRVKGVVQAEFPAVAVACDFDISLPDLEADAEQLTQAFLNVVRNAAQALADTKDARVQLVTRAARGVTVARKRHRLMLRVDVIDNGPGVPPELGERIFYPLVSGREGGSGLGLTLAQTYIAQHGGTIECASRPGLTTFTILLPLPGDRT
jgi:two-component system nitrogen regulation sensor histidine kinase GlnL